MHSMMQYSRSIRRPRRLPLSGCIDRRPGRLSADLLLFCLLAAVFLGTILVWVARDRTPPSWDDAYYLSNSLLLHDAIAKQGLPGLATQFLHLMRIKPPLVPTLAIPAYWSAGRNFKAAYGVNIASMLVVLYTVFRFGRKY